MARDLMKPVTAAMQLASLAGLPRTSGLIAAVAVVVCAGLAARTASTLVDARLATSARPATPPRSAPPPSPASPRARQGGDPFVARNIFCSSCEQNAGSEVVPATLIATALGPAPYAVLAIARPVVRGAWGPGDAIPGVGWLHRIGPTWVEIVDAAGGRRRISLRATAAGGPGTAIPGNPPAAAWGLRIARIDDQTYEIDRSLVRELVTGATRPGGMRAVPIFDRGAIAGVRLVGVAGDSIAAALGLRTGDRLTAVDGAPIRSLDQLLELYAGLDQRSSVELSGARHGQPLIRTLRLR